MQASWKLKESDSARIMCDEPGCDKPAKHGRTVNGGAPFFYECETHYPTQALETRDQIALRDARELIKSVAMDIGKDVAFHVESMYPEAVSAASSTFLLSVRNCTYNKIMAALDIDADNLAIKLTAHDKHRRYVRKLQKEPNAR